MTLNNNIVYNNRELSWLQFNERVLEETEDISVPLFERLTFISIFQSNLDEFFMVRVGSLFDQTLLKDTVIDSRTKMTSQEQLDHIYQKVKTLLPRKDLSYFNLMSEMSKEGMEQVSLKNLTTEEYDFLKLYFEKEILPLVSPQIIDKRQPFPFLKNKEIYVGIQLGSKSGSVRMGIISATGYFNRIVYLPTKDGRIRFALVEDLIWFFADLVFDKHQIVDKTIFRITRNADIDVEDEMLDVEFNYRDAMEELLKKRTKLAPVRLELFNPVSTELLEYMCDKFTLSQDQVFINTSPLDMSFVFSIAGKMKEKSELFFKPVQPQISNQIDETQSMISQVEKKDIIFHYPYNSIRPFIKLLNEASIDPSVVSIKITLYRVAKDSKVINALINAAEHGKEVNVVVELRARFDEDANIGWSKRLEEAGCNVIYGLPGYKVHSKLLLITRRKGNKIEYITQVGTGNYNEKTSTLYTDLSLMTANKAIGTDASVVFNNLFMGQVVTQIDHLLVAPLCLKPQIISFIDEEIMYAKEGKEAEIMLKMNSVTDKILIDKLVEASCAGVKITMLVRGICCIKAGVPGFTENITIKSIVGRFLEHSRILVFGVGARRKMYISSADFMTRNTQRRVEVAVPIYAEHVQQYVMDTFNVMLKDDTKARIMGSNGAYTYVKGVDGTINAQEQLIKQAYFQAQEKAKQIASNSTNPQKGKTKPKKGLFKRWKEYFFGA